MQISLKTLGSKTKTVIIILLLLLFSTINNFFKDDKKQPVYDSSVTIQRAYANKESKIQVSGSGVIVKVLKDDLKGSRHQRFIVKISKDLTVLIAHNIDLAPRINTIQKDDKISFYGVYEWNTKGGVIHWTHHDPEKRHIDGWLKYQGKIYQ